MVLVTFNAGEPVEDEIDDVFQTNAQINTQWQFSMKRAERFWKKKSKDLFSHKQGLAAPKTPERILVQNSTHHEPVGENVQHFILQSMLKR